MTFPTKENFILYIHFDGLTDMNGKDNLTDENTHIKTNSVVGFSYDGGRFHVDIDNVELYKNMIADDDFVFRLEQESNRGKKNQGVVIFLQDYELQDKERVQSVPDISIDGNSIITFGYDKNRLEIYVDWALVIKTTVSNDFSVEIHNV